MGYSQTEPHASSLRIVHHGRHDQVGTEVTVVHPGAGAHPWEERLLVHPTYPGDMYGDHSPSSLLS